MNRHNNYRGKPECGMTLLEILVALVIFTILAAAGYSGVYQGIAVQGQLQQQQQFWRRLDSVMGLIEMDLEQARALSPRVPVWDTIAFKGFGDNRTGSETEFMRFTRGGHQSFQGTVASPYLRIGYRLEEGSLYRVNWPGLNLPDGVEAHVSELINGVSDISLRYLDANRRWLDYWPLRFTAEESGQIPAAVEIILYFDNDNSFRRIFHVGPPR
jgi:general secretion pathway protein J